MISLRQIKVIPHYFPKIKAFCKKKKAKNFAGNETLNENFGFQYHGWISNAKKKVCPASFYMEWLNNWKFLRVYWSNMNLLKINYELKANVTCLMSGVKKTYTNGSCGRNVNVSHCLVEHWMKWYYNRVANSKQTSKIGAGY